MSRVKYRLLLVLLAGVIAGLLPFACHDRPNDPPPKSEKTEPISN